MKWLLWTIQTLVLLHLLLLKQQTLKGFKDFNDFASAISVFCTQLVWLMQYSDKVVGFSLKSRNQKKSNHSELLISYLMV